MRYCLRRNKFKIAGIVALAIIAFIIFTPSPQAKLNPPPSFSSLPLVEVCKETIRQAEVILEADSFVFISALDIEGNNNIDKITTYISTGYPLISHLTSNQGCVIDATIIDFSEAL